MTNCRRCEAPAPADARFCGTCGAALALIPDTAGSRKHVVVCFVDIVGSTSLGERLDPESLRVYLRRYFDAVSAVLVRHGASVEKFIGDAVMAVFGVPVAREADAARALLAAAEMHEAVAGISAGLASEYGLSLRVRIGVNGGEVFVSQHADGQLSVTGDAVNVAARLEQAAGPSQTLVGGTIPALAGPQSRLAFYGRHPGCPDVLVLRQGSEASAAALRFWPENPPRLVDVRRWRSADVLGHGSPHQPQGASRADLAEDDLDALIGAYTDSSKALFRRLSSRRGHFRRLDQIDRLLDLMRLDLNGEADVDEYAERIALGGPS